MALAPIVASLLTAFLLKSVEELFLLSSLALLLLIPFVVRVGDRLQAGYVGRVKISDLLKVERPPRHLVPIIIAVGVDIFA
jgi:hypothetical protein